MAGFTRAERIANRRVYYQFLAPGEAKRLAEQEIDAEDAAYAATGGGQSVSYYDASAERYLNIEHVLETVRSASGSISYRVAYRTPSGWVEGVRHRDRGDLMTDVRRLRRRPRWA